MNEKTFIEQFNRLAEFFEPPAHSPNFAKALFRALSTRLNDQEFHDATEALLETFRPGFGCPFPMVSHFMEAHREIMKGTPRSTDQAHSIETIEAKDKAFQAQVQEVYRLPSATLDRLRKAVLRNVVRTLEQMRATGISEKNLEICLNGEMVRFHEQEKSA